VTLDCDGSLVLERDGGVQSERTVRMRHPHVNGAGDTYIAAFTLATAAGCPTPLCARIASAAASVVVRVPGTATCTRADLERELRGPGILVDDESVRSWVASRRAAGQRIVFTNGVFDVLHRGHAAYLAEAARLGDVLIVGVNDDASVRRLKGPERPLNPVHDRMAVLAALEPVAAVASFGEDTPERLLHLVQPDVFVKGGDYSKSQLKEARLVEALGGEVVIAGYIPGQSTTGIIGRARRTGDVPRRRQPHPSYNGRGLDVA
jgi:D-beta-D-heptose 7-phosphate kinase/D-beta-D-heptose 1-phosphate adenosyltransferase